MDRIYRYIFLFISVVLIFSCSQKEEKIPKDIIVRDTMVKIMADVQMVEAVIQLRNLNASDSTKELAYGYYKFVFDKYKVTFDLFYKSYEFYENHPALMDDMYKDIITDISAKQANFHSSDTVFNTTPSKSEISKEDSMMMKKIRKHHFKIREK